MSTIAVPSPRAAHITAIRSQASFRTTVLLAGGALCLYAIAGHWGLPYATNELATRGWDVDGIAGMNVLAELHNLLIYSKSDWYVAYPLLHYLVLAVAYAPYLLILWLRGDFALSGASYPYGFEDPVAAFRMLALIGRVITIVMAVGIVLATREIGRRLWGERAGVAAAVIVLLCGPAVYYARTSNLDIPVQFWTVLGVLAAVIALQNGLNIRRALLIGVLAGFAVATKDQIYGAWLAGLVYLAVLHVYDARFADSRARWLPVAALLGGAALCYAFANGVVIRPDRFAAHVQFLRGFEHNFFNLQHPNVLSTLRPATFGGTMLLLGDVTAAANVAMGAPLIVLGVIGAITQKARLRATALLLLMLAGYLLLTILPVRHMQYRYAMFPCFVLALFAGATMVTRFRWRRLEQWCPIVLLLGITWEASRATDLTYQMARDARYFAGAWLADHGRVGDEIGFFGAAHQLPHLPAGMRPVRLGGSDEPMQTPDAHRTRWVLVAPDYFADANCVHSQFLSEPVYHRLQDGTLGYRRVATFRTRPLNGRKLPYLPYVNPDVQLYESVRRPL